MKAMTKIRRLAPVLALALSLLCAGVVQGQSTERAKRLGAKMMCMCGCGQILTACNHVGCTMSAAMLKQLDQRVATTESDDLLLQSFVQEYGQRAMAEPPSTGFNRLAWFIPGIAFVLGLGLVVLVIRQWRQRIALAPAAGPAVSPELLERVRRQADLDTED
jgi:cytochrome c-type biogenesis protein CcmH